MRFTEEELEKLSCKLAVEIAYCGPLQELKVGNKISEHTYIYGFDITKAKKLILKELIKLNEDY